MSALEDSTLGTAARLCEESDGSFARCSRWMRSILKSYLFASYDESMKMRIIFVSAAVCRRHGSLLTVSAGPTFVLCAPFLRNKEDDRGRPAG